MLRVVLLLLMPCFCLKVFGANSAIRININVFPITLDPPLLTNTSANWVVLEIGDRLVEFHQGGIRANLAKSWQVSHNFTQFNFNIAQNFKFSDGAPVSAYDVKRTFDRNIRLARESRYGTHFKNIESVEAKNGRTLIVKLKKSSPRFLQILSDPVFSIYKECEGPAGVCFTSSFAVTKFSEASNLISVLDKSNGQVYDLKVVKSQDLIKMFTNGELDIAVSTDPATYSKVAQLSHKKIHFPFERTYFVALNTKSKFFKERKQRCEYAELFDFNILTSDLLKLNLKITSELLPRELFGLKVVKKSVSNGANSIKVPPVEIIGIADRKPSVQMEQIIHRKVNYFKTGVFLSKIKLSDYDAAVLGYGITIRDWSYLTTFFSKDSAHNFAKVDTEETQKLVGLLAEKQSPKERRAIILRLLELNRKNCWYIPLFHLPMIAAYGKGIIYEKSEASNLTSSSPFIELKKFKRNLK